MPEGWEDWLQPSCDLSLPDIHPFNDEGTNTPAGRTSVVEWSERTPNEVLSGNVQSRPVNNAAAQAGMQVILILQWPR